MRSLRAEGRCLLPRATGDGLPLPWTPQQQRLAEERAAADRRARRAARPASVRVVYAYEQLPDDSATTVFLAGPTPRSADVASWRPDAIEELTRQWSGPGELVILAPEPRDGRWASDYQDQYRWEHRAMEAADTILFWVPRGPGMEARTTNIEWGYYCRSGRVVLGAPPEAPWVRYNRYLIHQAGMYDAPVAETMEATVREALTLAG